MSLDRQIDDLIEKILVKLKKDIEKVWKNEYEQQITLTPASDNYKDVHDAYQRIFDANWDNTVKNHLQKLINDIQLIKVVSRIFEVHPWLKVDNTQLGCITADVLDYLITRCLYSANLQLDSDLKKFANKLLKAIKVAAPTDDALIALGNNAKSGTTWNAIAVNPDTTPDVLEWDDIETKIQDYPYTPLAFNMFDNRLDEYDTLFSAYYRLIKSNETTEQEVINYSIKRIDLFRYLGNHNPEMKRLNYTRNYAIHNLEELRQLKQPPHEHIFLNISSEMEPLWIVLANEQGAWVAYIPKDDKIAAQVETALETLPQLSEVEIIRVNYQKNKALDNRKDTTDIADWHLILLGKVYPWLCDTKNKKIELTLDEYRKDTPLFVFRQYVHEFCIKLGFDFSVYNKVHTAFINSMPFTDETFIELIKPPRRTNRSSAVEQLRGDVRADNMLFGFDKNYISISDDLQTLQLTPPKTPAKEEYSYRYVFHFIYTIKISRLIIDSTENMLDYDSKYFLYDVDLRALKVPTDKYSDFKSGMRCVARNRFLDAFSPSLLAPDIKNRLHLWTTAGIQLLEFFRSKGPTINQEFADQVIAFNQGWRKSSCDHEMREDYVTDDMWKFVQIAQMGENIFFDLFNQLKIEYGLRNQYSKDPGPALMATFDLNGDLAGDPSTYMNRLSKHIEDATYAPLFQSLAFIIPDNMNLKNLDALKNLINVINQRKNKYPNELSEIVLYNVKREKLSQLIDELKRQPDLQIQINIPEWNRNTNDSDRELRAKYRDLQNHILNNQQKKHAENSEKNTTNMYALIDGKLSPSIIVSNKIFNNSKLWEGKDILYPISSARPGIQQQQQQEQQQEVVVSQQAQKQQQQEYVEESIAIDSFEGNEEDLLTRDNINDKCTRNWKELSKNISQLAAWQEKDWHEIFSLWVGSDKNATHIIEKIHPEALDKLIENASQFKMGVSSNNLPAGFYLTYSKYSGRGLILCYDDERRNRLLREREQASIDQCNPFTLELRQPMSTVEFRGDYRQHTSIIKAEPEMQDLQTVWQFLSIEDQDAIRMSKTQDYLNEHSFTYDIGTESVIKQGFDVSGELKKPKSFHDCLRIIKNCAKEFCPEEELLNRLFSDNETDPIRFTEINVKALGQLINHYGRPGFKHWLTTAYQIYQAFGYDNFQIWKKCILDDSVNWSECLEKHELDAVAQSIVTLKDKTHKDLWWQLIATQHRVTGHVRYADLWQAYTQLLALTKSLSMNSDCITQFLNQVNDFNAITFLERLVTVLRKANDQLNTKDIQQSILDNIAEIDWTNSGYYYACRYNQYPYWQKELQLTKFTRSDFSSSADYLEIWGSADNRLQNPSLHALRFASQRMKVSQTDLLNLNKILSDEDAKKLFYQDIRILMTCLALGIDSIDNLVQMQKKENIFKGLREMLYSIEFLPWLNGQFDLDGTLQSGLFNMRFLDIPKFFHTLSNYNILNDLYKLSYPKSLQILNAFGRAMRYFDSKHNDSGLEKLVTFAKHNGLDHPLIINYPWLIDEYNDEEIWEDPVKKALSQHTVSGKQELVRFQEQLSSIDLPDSTYLPDRAALTKYCNAISKADDGGKTRREIVTDLVKRGCSISFQDTRSRQLNEDEIKNAVKFLDKQLTSRFKKQNIKLCEKFFANLAVQNNAIDADKQIEALLKIFIEIDNKTYFDELGQLLGVLLSKINNKKQYFSISQLTTWLSALKDETSYELHHYPTNILQEILKHALASTDSTLLNYDLNLLEDKPNSKVQTYIEILARDKLPEEFKPLFAKLAMNENYLDFLKEAQKTLNQMCEEPNISNEWLNATTRLISTIIDKEPSDRARLFKLMTRKFSASPGLWQQAQIELINLIVGGKDISRLIESIPLTEKRPYIRIILLLSVGEKWQEHGINEEVINQLKDKLNALDQTELESLASYFNSKPNPSMETLLAILHSGKYHTKDIIHEFEANVLSIDDKGASKRSYSIDDNDEDNVMRVLTGMKYKGKGLISVDTQRQLLNLLYYCNTYSMCMRLDQLNMDELRKQLYINIKNLTDPLASARVLGCMREILLRKSGKWVNHTQMLNLLYAALHNDDSMIHQLRTGQGKSIITLMRTAYFALRGDVIDVFSAKDSLSKRDHDEFAPVLDALGINHAYIRQGSPPSAYQTTSGNGIGAINYEYVGNLSLFESGHSWEGNELKKPPREKRIAWLDECDHILKFEQTQFNYSTGGKNQIYNMDEWVYYAAYEFYSKNHDKFSKSTGTIVVSRQNELQSLYNHLVNQAVNAPQESTFIQDYILPALAGDPKAREILDQQLTKLLAASHIAKGMQEGQEFCIRPELKKVSDGMTIETRACKVMINNQISPGSTYSDLVQQFLHVRMNRKAAKRGEAPNFFIEPYTQVALSQNVQYILKNNYRKIEGCTGTAGNTDDLEYFQKVFGIDHVVKLPTHEEVKTKFLPTVYADNEENQINAIVEIILSQSAKQPILITCENDIAVKHLAEKIKAALINRNYQFASDKFIVDTNDSGKSENEVVPLCGEIGTITLSARMGRGTDIQPKAKDGSKLKEGLMVLRTYPAPPNVVKQEQGRQGRNGAEGSSQDIINYKAVAEQYSAYLLSTHKDRLEMIMTQQADHLESKRNKHIAKSSTKWNWINDDKAREKYLKTRSMTQLKFELLESQEKYLRRKEEFVAEWSGKVIRLLDTDMYKKNPSNRKGLCDVWLACREKIDAAWNARLTGKECDSDEVYQAFYKKAKTFVDDLQVDCPAFYTLPDGVIRKQETEENTLPKLSSEEIKAKNEKTGIMLEFYQALSTSANSFTDEIKDKSVIDTTFGNGLNEFYDRALELSKKTKEEGQVSALFNQLTSIVRKEKTFHFVSYSAMAELIQSIYKEDDNAINQKKLEVLQCFHQTIGENHYNKLTARDIEKYDALLSIVMRIAENFIKSKENFPVEFIKILVKIIRQDFWDSGFEKNPDAITDIFASTITTTKLFSDKPNASDMQYFIKLIVENNKAERSIAKARVKACSEYLATYSKELSGNSPIIHNVFALTLGDHINENYLPKPSLLAPKFHERFWYFLTQRAPIDNASCRNLIESLDAINFDEEILTALYKIPPHVTIQYIYTYIKDKLGERQKEHCKSALREIKEAGKAWNEFLQQEGIITSKLNYSIKIVSKFKLLSPYFEAMPPSRSPSFFKVLSEFSVQSDYFVSRLADAYIKNSSISPNTLRELAQLVTQMENMSNRRHLTFLDDQFELLLKQDGNHDVTIKSLNRYIKLVNSNPKVASLTQLAPIALYKISITKSDAELEDFCKALTKLKEIEKSMQIAESDSLINYFINFYNDHLDQADLIVARSGALCKLLTNSTERDPIIHKQCLSILRGDKKIESLKRSLNVLDDLRKLDAKFLNRVDLSNYYLQLLEANPINIEETNRRCDNLGLLFKQYTKKDLAVLRASLKYLKEEMTYDALKKSLSILKDLRKLEKNIANKDRRLSNYYLENIGDEAIGNRCEQLFRVIKDKQYCAKGPEIFNVCLEYLSGSVNAESLEQTLETFNVLTNLSKKINNGLTLSTKLIDKYFFTITQEDTDLNWVNSRYQSFAEFIHNNSDFVKVNDTEKMTNLYLDGKIDLAHLINYKNLISVEKDMDPHNAISTYFKSALDQVNINSRCQQLLDLLNKNQRYTYSECRKAVVDACIDFLKGIIELKGLSDMFAAIDEVHLLQANEQYENYFNKLNLDINQQERQKVMQSLEHQLVAVPDEFTNKCFDSYTLLATSQLTKRPKKLDDSESSRNHLMKCYHQVIKLTREIEHIAKSPIAQVNNVQAKLDNIDESFLKKKNAYFTKQHKRYNSIWSWKAEDRKTLANKLLESLSTVSINNKAEYYEKVLRIISNTQVALLEQDRNTNRNTKGYSRLYDITMQMFLKLTHEVLIDPSISFNEKAFLNELLRGQLQSHIVMFFERFLDDKSSHKYYAHKYPHFAADLTKFKNFGMDEKCIPGSDYLKDLNEFLLDLPLVPKNLVYLYNNLTCLIGLANTPTPSTEPVLNHNKDH